MMRNLIEIFLYNYQICLMKQINWGWRNVESSDVYLFYKDTSKGI